MPFVYELTFAEQSPQPDYTLVQQLIPSGTLVGTGQNIAVLSDGSSEFHLHAPLQGLLVEWLVASGDPVDPEDSLARIVAEGSERPVDPTALVKIQPF